MSGSPIGGIKAAATNKARHGADFYQRVGGLGGKNGRRASVLGEKVRIVPYDGFDGYWVTSNGFLIGKNGKPKKNHLDKKGYLRVQAGNSRKAVITEKVHRLVARHFIPNPKNLPQVDHINGDKSDNRAANLEWVTNDENQRRAVARGAYLSRQPEALTSYGGQILTAIEKGYLGEDLFKATGVNRKTFWSAVAAGRVQRQDITDLPLGRKKKYYYFDASRNKWRVERSDSIATGKQFDTEAEAREYANAAINGGGFASDLIGPDGLTGRQRAAVVGAIGGKIGRRKSKKHREASEIQWDKANSANSSSTTKRPENTKALCASCGTQQPLSGLDEYGLCLHCPYSEDDGQAARDAEAALIAEAEELSRRAAA